MGFQERVEVLIDVTTDRASTALANFRTSVGEADGVIGKFRAGAGAAFDTIKENAATMAMAAGTALFKLGADAVTAFTDLALEVGKFSDATGIAADEASRLIEVAGDVDISSGTLQTAIQKFSKSIADGSLDIAKYGVSLTTASDGSVDIYNSFIDVATAIGAIEDPTQRAQAAQAAFGKSYGEIAELMEMDAEELRAALASVSDTKVIDQSEINRAREFRDSMDNLKDTFEEIQLAVGERLIPGLSLAAAEVTAIINGIKQIPGGKYFFGPDAEEMNKVKILLGLMDDYGLKVGETIPKSEEFRDALGETGNAAEKTGTAFHGMSKDAWDSRDAMNDAKKAADDLERAVGALHDQLSDHSAWLSLQEDFNNMESDLASGELSWNEMDAAVTDMKLNILDYIADVGNIPADKVTEILALLDQNKVAEVMSILDNLARSRTATITPVYTAPTGALPQPGQVVRFATGTENASGGTALVGEYGPELVRLPRGASVTPAHETRTGATGGGDRTYIDNRSYEIIMPASAAVTKDMLQEWSRINYEL